MKLTLKTYIILTLVLAITVQHLVYRNYKNKRLLECGKIVNRERVKITRKLDSVNRAFETLLQLKDNDIDSAREIVYQREVELELVKRANLELNRKISNYETNLDYSDLDFLGAANYISNYRYQSTE